MQTRVDKRNLLLVEDHRAFARAMELVLTVSGMFDSVVVAGTLSEGRRLALAGETPFAAAVVDLMLPDGDGEDLVRQIKGRLPGMPVLVLSAKEDLSGARAAGADEVLGKDYPLPGVIGAVDRLLNR
jgi:two-component system, OmpR family, response regulator QseB